MRTDTDENTTGIHALIVYSEQHSLTYSATVERLFSVVGMAFADKRNKSTHAETLAELAFTKLNLET